VHTRPPRFELASLNLRRRWRLCPRRRNRAHDLVDHRRRLIRPQRRAAEVKASNIPPPPAAGLCTLAPLLPSGWESFLQPGLCPGPRTIRRLNLASLEVAARPFDCPRYRAAYPDPIGERESGRQSSPTRARSCKPCSHHVACRLAHADACANQPSSPRERGLSSGLGRFHRRSPSTTPNRPLRLLSLLLLGVATHPIPHGVPLLAAALSSSPDRAPEPRPSAPSPWSQPTRASCPAPDCQGSFNWFYLPVRGWSGCAPRSRPRPSSVRAHRT